LWKICIPSRIAVSGFSRVRRTVFQSLHVSFGDIGVGMAAFVVATAGFLVWQIELNAESR
jgi:hypothetical protein